MEKHTVSTFSPEIETVYLHGVSQPRRVASTSSQLRETYSNLTLNIDVTVEGLNIYFRVYSAL
jgi:hypothetical protein